MKRLCTNVKNNIPSFLKHYLKRLDRVLNGYISKCTEKINSLEENKYYVIITKTQ